jgi:hypothetical protein
MEREFVPYELAVKLKALGFNRACFGLYAPPSKTVFLHHYGVLTAKEQVLAPLYQQVFRWFKEEHGLQHDITLTTDKELTGFYVLIHKLDGLVFNEDDAIELGIETTNREEAEIIILDKMIEIVELKQQEQ